MKNCMFCDDVLIEFHSFSTCNNCLGKPFFIFDDEGSLIRIIYAFTVGEKEIQCEVTVDTDLETRVTYYLPYCIESIVFPPGIIIPVVAEQMVHRIYKMKAFL